jgi:hypothetical protein
MGVPFRWLLFAGQREIFRRPRAGRETAAVYAARMRLPRTSLLVALASILAAPTGCNAPEVPSAAKARPEPARDPGAASLPRVTSSAEVAAQDGRVAVVVGVYHAIPVPRKGSKRDDPERPKEYAVITLADGTGVYLEPYATPEARRPAEEMARFDGTRVEVSGRVRRIMPAEGQSLVAPCVEGVIRVVAAP